MKCLNCTRLVWITICWKAKNYFYSDSSGVFFSLFKVYFEAHCSLHVAVPLLRSVFLTLSNRFFRYRRDSYYYLAFEFTRARRINHSRSYFDRYNRTTAFLNNRPVNIYEFFVEIVNRDRVGPCLLTNAVFTRTRLIGQNGGTNTTLLTSKPCYNLFLEKSLTIACLPVQINRPRTGWRTLANLAD